MDISTIETTSEELTPKEYLELLETDKNNIADVNITPPRLGEKGFGRISVKFKVPVYKAVYEQ